MQTRRRALAGLAALTTAAAMLATAAPGATAAPSEKGESKAKAVELQLLAINDFHGNLQPPTGSSGSFGGTPAGGAAFLATHLAQLRAGQEHSLTVAAGDLIGASPLVSALFHDEPTIEALGGMGLDVAGVGNHEFDEGADELLRIAEGGCHPVDGCTAGQVYEGADFPFLAANVTVDDEGGTLFDPYWVRQVKGVKVGFIGMTLEGTPDIVSASGIAGLSFADEADTANRYAAELQRQGVETIVVLLHEGLTTSTPTVANGCPGASGPLVGIVERMAPSIDVVVSGHTHQAYTCELEDKLVTSGSAFGRLVTDIRLTLSSSSKDVVAARANNVVVTRDVPQDAATAALVQRYVDLAAPLANRTVGTVAGPVLRAPGPNGESPLGDVIADAQLAATRDAGAVVALMNPGGIRGDVAFAGSSAGEGDGVVTYGEAFTVQPFNNLLTTVSLTGEQLLAVLEQQYRQNSTVVLQPAGLTYSVSASAPLGSKVVPGSVRVAGAPLDLAATYRVTVNNFLAGGGDGFSTLRAGTAPFNSGLDIDAFVDYLGANPGLTPPAADRITRVP